VAAKASGLVAARAEEEAAAGEDAAHEAAVDAKVLCGGADSSVSAKGSADVDLELLAMDAAREWAMQ
jgi:hypothetical protein